MLPYECEIAIREAIYILIDRHPEFEYGVKADAGFPADIFVKDRKTGFISDLHIPDKIYRNYDYEPFLWKLVEDLEKASDKLNDILEGNA